MAEHKRTSQQKPEETDKKHRIRQQESKPLFEDFDTWEQGTHSVTEAPFRPQTERHAAWLAEANSNKKRANLVLQLQRTYGNRYVQRLLGSKKVQTKLTVNAPNDIYEQEADRVAGTVTKAIASQTQRQAEEEEEVQARLQRQPEEEEEVQARLQRQPEEEEDVQARLQRQSEEEEEVQTRLQRQPEEEEEEVQTRLQRQPEEEEEEVQTKPLLQRADISAVPQVDSEMEDKINAARGSGESLDNSIRSPMEQAFGADFSRVRVHTDTDADTLSQSLQARAFTTGKDIFFKSGEYTPESNEGQKLLAHELTHTIQQGASTRVARWLGKGHGIITELALEQVGDMYSKKAKNFLADRAGQMDLDPDTFFRMKIGQNITKEKMSHYRGRKRQCLQNHLTLKKLIEKRNKLQQKYDSLENKSGFFAERSKNKTLSGLLKLREKISPLIEEQKTVVTELKRMWGDNELHVRYPTHHPEHGEAGAYREGGKASENAAKVNEKIVRALARFNAGQRWTALEILADALHGAEDRGAHGEGEPFSGHDTRLKFADEELIFSWEKIAKGKPRKDAAHGGDWTDNVDRNSGEVPKSLALASFVLKQFQENLDDKEKKRLRNLGKWWRFWEREEKKPGKRSPLWPHGGEKKWSEYAAETELPKNPQKEFKGMKVWPFIAAIAEKLFVGMGEEGTNMTLKQLRQRYPHEHWKDYAEENQEFMDWHLNELLKKYGEHRR